VRIQAASALVKLGNTSETVVDALIKCLKDDNSFVRIQAAEALGKLGKTSDKILPCIIQWLEQHQESKFIGSGIDVLWGCIVEE
jgi:vesicle coat complex subunit